MKQVTHALSGSAVGASISVIAGEDLFSLTAIGAGAGIAPDLDHFLAIFSKRFHRSPATHSVLAACIIAFAWAATLSAMSHLVETMALGVSYIVGSSLVVFSSVFVHAAEDSLTVAGCRLFYPFSRRRWAGPFRYDDALANAALSLGAAAAMILAAGSVW